MSLWRRIRPILSLTLRFFHISSIEARNQHSGTRLGLLWTPLAAIIFSAVLALVFRHSDTVSGADFFLYVFCGYVFWGFVSDSLTGSTNVIQSQLEFAVHNNLSVLGLFAKALVDRLFEYFMNVGVLVVMILVLRPSDFSMTILLFPAFLGLIVLASLGGSYLINIGTILYPDMKTGVQVGARFMFFASPVFWSAEASHGARALLVTYNPVAYYLTAGRQVFGLQPFEPFVWLVMAVTSMLVAVLGYLAFVASQDFVRNFK
ncbi:ABC transporter permease [Rhizobium rhizophilum]|uniref:ABC transporter n=1 Tax=Rhizobium rhizophilum TaxID=1850373 RepID=A0ABY2QR65_9HYPH|nr:ABC transporter permease [Rhizobium rhizophilum]THV10564.1 ABC transporter [Rhizobium rhizophilum]